MATPSALLKIQIAYLNSPTPKTNYSHGKISSYRVQKCNHCNFFCVFWPKLGCHGNPLSSLENLDSILECPTPITMLFTRKILDILYRTEISAILDYFCQNLVAMATPFAPLKIQIAYLNSPTPITTSYTQKVFRYLVRN